MLYNSTKKEAMKIYEKAVNKYNAVYEELQDSGLRLYQKRKDALKLVENVETLINSIANSPKEFEVSLREINVERGRFTAVEEYAKESVSDAIKSGASLAAGVAGGAAVASMAPTAAMWVATTFGTASTGTAISALHGAVATKAALAWLGGGALSAGGAGIAGGQALLALAGPIGWGIAGISTVTSAAFLGHKNKKISEEAMAEAKKITIAGAQIHETDAKIRNLFQETKVLTEKLSREYDACKAFNGVDYSSLPGEDRVRLGTLVNNTLSLAQLMNKHIEDE